MLGSLGYLYQIGLVTAKFQVLSWARSGWKICAGGGGFQVTTMSSLNPQ